MELRGKRVVVMGFGPRTGPALVRYLSERGAHVRISESSTEKAVENRLKSLKGMSIEAEFGGHTEPFVCSADLIVLCPGVPVHLPVLSSARQKNILIISEIELAFLDTTAPIVAVTGTNGKSTATTLIGDMLIKSGMNVFCGGNLGTPMIEAAGKNYDVVVAEVSSFQLSAVDKFRPKVGVMLNCTPDHMDWHSSMEEYASAKAAMFSRMAEGDSAVLNAQDELGLKLGHSVHCDVFYFSSSSPTVPVSAERVEDSAFKVSVHGKSHVFSINNPRLSGAHNMENAMAAALAALLIGAQKSAVQIALDSFAGLPHRIEPVAEIEGVRFIDDSKGTNPDAAARAVESVKGPLVLIAGGKEKNLDFDPVVRALKNTDVRAVVCMGENKKKLAAALVGSFEVIEASNMEQAVRSAFAAAKPDGTVLLSPATSSFDMYGSYSERGDDFKRCVAMLKEEVAS